MKMKAALLKEIGKPLVFEEVDIPELDHGEVLIRVKVVGMCGTDIDIIDGHMPPRTMPWIPGHEVAGIVERVHPEVTLVKKGDRVVAGWLAWTCGYCSYCVTGRENLCGNVLARGFTTDGVFSEFVKAAATHVLKMPDNVSFEQAVVACCSVATSCHALSLADFSKPGTLLLVSGVGGVGIYAIQIAKSLGARVLAVSRTEERLKIAKEFGADYVVSPVTANPAEYTQKELGGADIALVLAPSGKAADQAFRALKRGGTLVIVGTPWESMSISLREWIRMAVKAVGSQTWTREDLRLAMNLVSDGTVRPRIERHRFDEINEVVTRFRDGKIMAAKAVMLFD